MSLFGDSLSTIVAEIHRAEGSPVITYTPAGSAAVVLVAVFDVAGTVIDLATGAIQRTTEPRLGVVLADLPVTPRQGDAVDVDGIGYAVVDVDPDGQGGASLTLRRA